MVEWKEYIKTDEKVFAGKPIIKNIRLSVELISPRLYIAYSNRNNMAILE